LPPLAAEVGEEASLLLREIITLMGIESTTTCSATEDGDARINVESNDSALLIGRKGKNLQSLQYLINRMVLPRDTPENIERIMVDIEDYLDRRRASLEEMAVQLANKAKETGRSVRVKPLTAQERRIIHLVLQNDPDIKTFSTGTGELKNVIIAPKGGETDGQRNPRRSGGGEQTNRRGKGSRTRSRGHGRRPSEGHPAENAPLIAPDNDGPENHTAAPENTESQAPPASGISTNDQEF